MPTLALKNQEVWNPSATDDTLCKNMTVCIAAIAENGKKLVLAADDMITQEPFSIKKEATHIKKIIPLTKEIRVLIAGWTTFGENIVQNAKNEHREIKDGISIKKAADLVKIEYDKFRESWLENLIIKPKGFSSLKEYHSLRGEKVNSLTTAIDHALTTNIFDVQLIIAGVLDGKAELYLINNFLPVHSSVPNGFFTTGSGGQHAAYVMTDMDYAPALSIEEVEEIVKKAKEKSEKTTGVGKGMLFEILPPQPLTQQGK